MMYIYIYIIQQRTMGKAATRSVMLRWHFVKIEGQVFSTPFNVELIQSGLEKANFDIALKVSTKIKYIQI